LDLGPPQKISNTWREKVSQIGKNLASSSIASRGLTLGKKSNAVS
jgi:hypothetical protein